MTMERPPATPEAVGRSARMIYLSLATGVFLMALVCVVLTRTGTLPLHPDSTLDERMLLLLWIAVALGSAMGAILVWRGRIEPIVTDRTVDAAPAGNSEKASRLATHLIVCWALVEGPSLLGLVLFMQTGDWTMFALGVAFGMLGFSLAAPRLAWFRVEGARS